VIQHSAYNVKFSWATRWIVNLDGDASAILAWDIRPQMREADAEIVIQRAQKAISWCGPASLATVNCWTGFVSFPSTSAVMFGVVSCP
jgi:hypothetical protein